MMAKHSRLFTFVFLFCLVVVFLCSGSYASVDEVEEEDCGCSSLNRDAVDLEKESEGKENSCSAGNDVVDDIGRERSSIELEVLEAIKAGKVKVDASKPELVDIPGGKFTMGTDQVEIPLDGEGPARETIVSPFRLMKYEVSNAQYAAFVLDTGHISDAEKFGWSFVFENVISEKIKAGITQAVANAPWWLPVHGSNWLHPEGPDSNILTSDRWDHPVVHISHNDARKFCAWMNMRLPREAEFERAARGGKENRLYPWGNNLYPRKEFRANLWQGKFPKENTAEDGYAGTAPVKSFPPQNNYGLHNIVGNVWEWVADAWNVRHSNKQVYTDPQFEYAGRMDDPEVERTKRGGSYMCHKSYCFRYRVAARSSNSADSTAGNLGVRCAADIEEE